jgi:Sulfotransferase domain
VSHFVHRQVVRPGTLEDAFADPFRREGLVAPSRYWLQLEQYLGHFPAEQILVVDSDELRGRRAETLERVFAFLGVDASFRAPEFAADHNTATGHSRPNRAGRVVAGLLERTVSADRALALRTHAPAALKASFRARVEPPALSADLRERLTEELREDVKRLRAFTGRAFAGWSL